MSNSSKKNGARSTFSNPARIFSNKPQLSNLDPTSHMIGGEGGIGLSVENIKGIWIVKSIIPGEAADQNGQIKIGDALVTVSGSEVKRCSFETISQFLAGKPGSTVRVGLERADVVTNRIFFYEVDLRRKCSADETQPSSNWPTHTVDDAAEYNSTTVSRDEPRNSKHLAPNNADSSSFFARVKVGAPTTPRVIQTAPRRRISTINQGALSTPVSSGPATPALSTSLDGLHALELVASSDFPATPAGADADQLEPTPPAAQPLLTEHALRSELEALRSQLAEEARRNARQLEEQAEHERALRSTEEARAAAALEREGRAMAMWKEEAERRREAEARADGCAERLARCEAQLRSTTPALEAATKEETAAQVPFFSNAVVTCDTSAGQRRRDSARRRRVRAYGRSDATRASRCAP